VSGPLSGIKIIELAGIGPGPFAAMALADAGADVIRIDREVDPNQPSDPVLVARNMNVMNRGRRSIRVDLKRPGAAEFIMSLVERSDGLIEGFRPGVTERLGIGPEACAERNPRLVYGRVTGWGRTGPYSMAAGHDIDYIALSGTLGAIGPVDRPPEPPLNLLGDFGGGGLLLAYGMTCALLEVAKSGRGQTVDAAMIDGTAYLTTYIYGMRALGIWSDERGSNIHDGGAPFYDIYETSDHQFVAVGAIEPQFFQELLEILEMSELGVPIAGDRSRWPVLRDALIKKFKSRTRDEWESLFAGTNACVAPVLSLGEAPKHEHLREWGTFVEYDGVIQPAPAPRFSRTPGAISRPAPLPGQGGRAALADWGFDETEIESLVSDHVIGADK
jgi:alpha-methylacyl-CoA racemase